MAVQFCVQCGTPIPSGGAFCPKCGAPAPPGEAQGNGPAAAGAAAPPEELDAALGLRGQKRFLVQHQLLSLGHSYRVMDAEKRHLFTVEGHAGQNVSANLLGGLAGGGYLGRLATRSLGMTYTLSDARGGQHGTVVKEGGANASTFTLTDARGQRRVVITLERGLMGGMTAKAIDPSGQPLFQTSGNLLRHNFVIKDAQGRELVKVHEAWVAVRDTYNVDLLGPIDPLYPLVFTILIDFEKVK